VVTPSKVPAYNLRVVLRETGLKADTIRAWERRYGLPDPERSSGGHRLYSLYDIETIKWLQARQKEGLRINRAVELWRSTQEMGQDPLLARSLEMLRTPVPTRELLFGKTLNEMKENWKAACLAFDEQGAENILAQALARYPLETVCVEILQKGLSEIGDLWYAGESTVQQEHFASSLAIRRLDALLAAAPAPTRNGRILIGCPPGENHIFPPLMVTLFLRYRGYDVIYLGANVPIAQLGNTVTATKPTVVVLTAQRLTTASSLHEAANSLQELNVPLGYGGLIFNRIPGLRKRIGGHFLGDRLEQAVHEIERLMTFQGEIPQGEGVNEVYINAYSHFSQKQALIEAYLYQQYQDNGMQKHYLELANKFIGKDILASLILGDLDFLNSEMDWIKGMLDNYNIPGDLLLQYLAHYKLALQANQDQACQPIVNWLDRMLAEQSR